MKKLFLLLIFFIHSNGFSQDVKGLNEPKLNWTISSQPLPLLFGIANANFYFKASHNLAVSLPVTLGYLYPLTTVSGQHHWGALSGLGLRWSINSPLFSNGWYVDSQIKVGFMKFGDFEYKGVLIIPSIGAGYAWYFKNRFFMSLGLEANLLIMPQGFGPAKNYFPFKFPFPLINYSIGYVF